MAGTPVGSVDHLIPNNLSVADGQQNFFKIVYDFFNVTMVGAGYATRMNLSFGAGGTGTDFHDGANPFGENAWALFRMDSSASRPGGGSALGDYYVLLQWADSDSFGLSPGDPGQIQGGIGDGVAIAAAFREDGGDPWAARGTAHDNNDGTDRKGLVAGTGPVWVPGASTVHVLSVANSPGGADATNKDNMHRIDDLSSSNTFARIHCVGDADSFFITVDVGDNGTYGGTIFTGLYTPRDGLTVPYPIVSLGEETALPFSEGTQVYGTVNGTSNNEGGLVGRLISDGVGPFGLQGTDPLLFTASGTFQPNQQSDPPELDGLPIRLARLGNRVGYVGNIETNVMAAVFNIASNQNNIGFTRAYFGSSNSLSLKLSVPWTGVAAPGLNGTRGGIQF